MTEVCGYVTDEDEGGVRCGHPREDHESLAHPMPGGPLIMWCNRCAHTPAYTHYYVEETE